MKKSLSAIAVEKYFIATKAKDRYNKISLALADGTFVYEEESVDIKKIADNVTEKVILDRKVYIINDGENKDTLFYFCGGGYINAPNRYQYIFLDKLSKATGLRIIITLYGRVPKYNYKTEIPILIDIYKMYLPSCKRVFMGGDSSGGGLALNLAYHLRDLKYDLPTKLVLFSPWVDISLKNPKIKEVTKLDKFLDVGKNSILGDTWTCGNMQDSYASPLYGDVKGLPEVVIYTGTHDILYPDMVLYKEKLDENNIPNKFIAREGMLHVYVIYPITEAKVEFSNICKEFE